LIDLQSVFDTAFPNVKIKPIKRGIFIEKNQSMAGHCDTSSPGKINKALSRLHTHNAKE
jgi:hypothetical protein